jgi:hypothetical protein
MAVMDSALTTLASAKMVAGVSSGDTTDDAVFERFINKVSMAVSSYCDRIFARGTFTEQVAPQNRQLLLLKQWPIVSITSVTDNGSALVQDTDYRCDAQDMARGELYKENGWMGSMLVTGLTLDPVAAARLLVIVYIAGYHLPSDPLYIEGDAASLPLDISAVVDELVATKYYARKRMGFGLSSYKEGGLSFSYSNFDLQAEHGDTLNKYRRWL